MPRSRRTSDAVEILDHLIADDGELRAWIDEEVQNAELAHLLRTARTTAGLTQQELAERRGLLPLRLYLFRGRRRQFPPYCRANRRR